MKLASKKPVPWKIVSFVFFVLALVAIGFSAKMYLTLQNIQDPEYQKILADRDTEELISEIGEFYLLPEGTPQIAVVSDPVSLKKEQPFFEKAEAGDRVLVYPDTAILYRPSTEQIIHVWPVTSTSSEPVQN